MAKKTVKQDNKVPVTIPRGAKGEDTHQFVSVNGKTYRVKKGTTVMVPREVAEVLAHSEIARAHQEEALEANARAMADKAELK